MPEPESGNPQPWDESEPAEDCAVDQVETAGKTSHACNVCQRVFKKISHLKQHYRSHTGIRYYFCVFAVNLFACMCAINFLNIPWFILDSI